LTSIVLDSWGVVFGGSGGVEGEGLFTGVIPFNTKISPYRPPIPKKPIITITFQLIGRLGTAIVFTGAFLFLYNKCYEKRRISTFFETLQRILG
jgi:hypothetical protein